MVCISTCSLAAETPFNYFSNGSSMFHTILVFMADGYVLGCDSQSSMGSFPRGIHRHAPKIFQIQTNLGISRER